MMLSLFSSMDLNLSNASYSKYIYILIVLIVIMNKMKYYLMNNETEIIMNNLMYMSTSMTMESKGKKFITMNMSMYLVFIIMLSLNVWGMIPYIFPMSSHLMLTLSYGLSLWLTMVIQFAQYPMIMLSSQIPSNSPLNMSMFLSLVEGVSNIIRPLTLSFRLAANMSAGHIILSMISLKSISIMLMSAPSLYFFIGLGTLYEMFEMIISFVQAFVFMLLLIMYSNDYVL